MFYLLIRMVAICLTISIIPMIRSWCFCSIYRCTCLQTFTYLLSYQLNIICASCGALIIIIQAVKKRKVSLMAMMKLIGEKQCEDHQSTEPYSLLASEMFRAQTLKLQFGFKFVDLLTVLQCFVFGGVYFHHGPRELFLSLFFISPLSILYLLFFHSFGIVLALEADFLPALSSGGFNAENVWTCTPLIRALIRQLVRSRRIRPCQRP